MSPEATNQPQGGVGVWIAGAQQGNEEAKNQLYAEFHEHVEKQIPRNIPEAAFEEITQESWLRILKGIGKFDLNRDFPGSVAVSFMAWINTIVSRVVASYSRKVNNSKLVAFGMSPEGEATSLLDTQESTELPAPDALAEREKIERVRQAVSNLSDEERRLVTAYYWKDRTQSDIAQELGLDQGTIGRRLAKVEQSLRKALE